VQNAGIALSHIDPAVRPQDDLFRHVNGRWLAATEIPDDRALQGSFTQLRDEAEAAVRDIILDAASSAQAGDGGADAGDNGKIGALYSSFMDTATADRLGAGPVQPMLERIAAVSCIEELVRTNASLTRYGIQGLAAAYVGNDAGSPDRYILHLYQSGLGMPDESYYRDEQFAESREAYAQLLEKLLALADLPDVQARAAAVLDLETRLAASHMDAVTRRDPQAVYNLHTGEALRKRAPFIMGWLSEAGVDPDHQREVVVCQPDYLAGVVHLLEEIPLDVWKAWLATRVLLHAADYLSADFVDAAFAFYGTHLSGTPAIKERWKRAVTLVEGAVGEAVGREYVARHFPQSHKAAMQELVGNLLAAYEQSIRSLGWMGEGTRQRALEKLGQFTTKVGYPDEWIDYSALDIRAGDLYGNVCRASEFEHNRQLHKLAGPVDRNEWHMTPQTVNAYYMPTMNEIVFPAAILQPPFFDAEADPAANYGAIGAVIGHEIGHGFDDQGSQFDGRGSLTNWWTAEDRAAFEALTAQLVEQYGALSPAETPGQKVNGRLTLGENIGDLGGLAISNLAYSISLAGAEAPVIGGLSGRQRFFYSWAECWRQKIRAEEATRRLTIDPHSPNEFRCNQVVRNLDGFHEAFGVTSADKLWLEPEARVRIW
jgi:putative endopeptidase